LNPQKYGFDPLYHKSEIFNSAFSEFSRYLPFSKWLPKHGIKMGGKNSTLSDIIKI
jgi:hypothetical protein